MGKDMVDISYGTCSNCSKLNHVFTVHQYMKVNNLTTKGKKFFSICYACSDELIQTHNKNAIENPQDFLQIPFDSNDSRKNAKVIQLNSSFENSIFELVNENVVDETIEDEPTEVKFVEYEGQNGAKKRPDLRIIQGGGQTNIKKNPVPGKLPKYSAQEIFEKLSQKIIGQDEGLKTLSIATERYLESITDSNVKKITLLVTGNSAMGKSASIEALKDIVGIPVLTYNMKQFTAAGYVGRDVSEIVSQVCEITQNNERPRAIVLLDEIDKLGSDGSGESFLKEDVFYELLTIIEGREMVVAGKKNTSESAKNVDTSELFFVLAGSFHKVMDKKAAKNNYVPVGLSESRENIIKMRPEMETPVITNQELINYGMPREFVGRIHVKVPFRTLSEDEYVDLIRRSTDSPLKSYVEYFRKRNVEIEFTDDYLKEISKIVVENGLGVRGVVGVLEKDLKSLIFDIGSYAGETLEVGPKGEIFKTEKNEQAK